MWVGSFHACSVDVTNLNHTLEFPVFASLSDLNNAQAWRAARRSMWAPTQGIGPPERHKNAMTRRSNIREVWCGVVTRRVGQSYRIHLRVRSGIDDFRNTQRTVKHSDITVMLSRYQAVGVPFVGWGRGVIREHRRWGWGVR